MKQKKIFILAAAALAFAACSSDESPTAPEQQETGAAYTQGEVPVAFDAYVNRATTRAGWAGDLAATDQIKATAVGGFGVFAYYTDNELYSENAKPNFMYNQQVTFDSDWKYSPIKYWPNEFGATAESDGVDKLSFFAYAPYVAVDVNTGIVTGNNKTTGIVALTRNTTHGNPMVKYYASMDPTKSVDLCYGVSAEGFTGVNTNEPFINVVKPNITSKIKFNFVHALASLNVQIDADINETAEGATDYLDANTKIYVRSVTFEGFTNKGMLDLNSVGTVGYKPNWYDLSGINTIGSGSVTIFDGRRDGREGQANSDASNETPNELNPVIIQNEDNNTAGVPATAPVNLFDVSNVTGDADVKLAAPIYVIPTGQSMKVTIVYDVETKDPNLPTYLSDGATKGSSVENRITKEIKIGNTSDPITMAAGKKYTVKLHLGMNSVKFDAVVAGWETGNTGEPWLPNNE